MKSASLPTILTASAGLAVWAVLIPLPLVVLYTAPSGSEGVSLSVSRLALHSFLLAGGVSAAAVVLGYLPGRLLGSSGGKRRWLFPLMLMPLLLPRYVLYYAWSLLLTPTHALGAYISARPELARPAGTIISTMVMVLWYWPLAALLIAQGWAVIDRQARNAARLDAGAARRFLGVTLPLLAWPLAMAFGVCFAMSLSEFGAFHLAGVETVGTELAMMYQLTGSAGTVARSAWPMAAAAVLVGLLLSKRSKDWSVNPPTDADNDRRQRPCLRIVTAGLIGFSLLIPPALLIVNFSGLEPLRMFIKLHRDGLAWSMLISTVAAALTVLIAGGAMAIEKLGKFGRLLSAVMNVSIFLAMFLPGSLIAVALIKTMGLFDIPGCLWYAVSAGLAARFAGVALILFRLAADSRQRHLAEMASVDGASPAKAWLHVQLPRTWPTVLGAFVLVVMLGVTELPATMVLLPAGLPNFAQRLLNQMHYARDQHVITSCLMLIAVYVILGVFLVVMFRRCVPRGAAVVLLCAALFLTGCDSASDTPGKVDVVDAIGRTGRGPGEFIYPRAIDLAGDGSLFVADKTGRIQHFDRTGKFLGVIQMPLIEAGKPTGISIGPDGNLYVADTHYHRIVVFSPAGKMLRKFGRFGQTGGCFIYPTDVAFAPDGRIFVSEYGGNDRVSIFSPKGKFLGSFGSPGSGEGFLSRPSALCVDAERNKLYVADACNHRIAVYNLDGELTGYIGSTGQRPGQLRYPYDLALMDNGSLLVCEYGNNRLQVFSPDGRSMGTFGAAGRQLGQLAYPWAVTVDGRSRAYVVDAGNNRVQVWQL
ncbi:MAG: 6-bladed beta-propeller [Planctomycetota bacterium]|nr:6-bladed beta-propeller [Planctomycetota bacterium]